MRFDLRKAVWCVTLVPLVFAFGCAGAGRTPSKQKTVAEGNDLGPTIGSLAEIFASDVVPVRSYGLVGGLNGTGSSECPAPIRTYLEKYILQHLSGRAVDVDKLISSPDTAVVTVEGIIPPAAFKNQRFDVRIVALAGTQTTSLVGGWLYGADLAEARQLGISVRSLAAAEGPVYVDSIGPEVSDPRVGFVLGGAAVLEDYKISLALRRPDYIMASQIRNRINERFGYEIAEALAPGSIELQVPNKYTSAKGRFVRLVRATFLTETTALTEKRIDYHIRNFLSSANKDSGEIALEAIGKASLPKLAAVLDSADPEIRFRVARCMLNLGDQRGREVLWNIVLDGKSPYRIVAIEAMVNNIAKEDAASMLRSLLHDGDFQVRLAAYENLVRLNDVSVSREQIAGSFYLDEVSQPGKPALFVYRKDRPCVVIFGSPVYCRNDVFVETADKAITINVPADARVATVIRKHPRHPDVIIRLDCSLDLADVIRTLCREPQTPSEQGGPGLGVSYSTLLGLLKQMVDANAVDAEFHAGPLSKQAPIIKK